MTDTKKFMFDTNDFNNEKALHEATYTEEQLLLAKQQSYAQGKTDGTAETRQQQEEMIVALLNQISQMMLQISLDEDRREVEKCTAATKLALQVIQKVLPKFAEDHAITEIEHTILKSIEARKDEARIVATVPTQHLDAIKSRIDALALEKGYAGKIILLADDYLNGSDCRVEWADGGAERLYTSLLSQIEGEFNKAIVAINTDTNTEIKS